MDTNLMSTPQITVAILVVCGWIWATSTILYKVIEVEFAGPLHDVRCVVKDLHGRAADFLELCPEYGREDQ